MARKAGELGLSILPSPTIRGASRWRTDWTLRCVKLLRGSTWARHCGWRARMDVRSVNSQPDRLDLTDTWFMAAKHAGVKLVVPSDAHSPRDFELLEYGVNQTQRGWIEADEVLNTRPLKSLRPR